MYSKLISWSRYAYLAGIVLAMVLIIPAAWFPFQLAKVAVFALLLLVAAVLFVWGGGVRELVRSHGLYGALLVGLLPLAYVLSYLFSVDKSVAITGFGIEGDTIVFVTLLFLAFIMGFALFRTLRTTRMLLTVLMWSLVVAAVFQGISIVFGPAAIPFATFADRSVNLIGKWNDLGLIVGLLSLFLIMRVELMTVSSLARAVIGVVLLGLVALLGIINFTLVWGLVLVFSLVLGIVRFLIDRRAIGEEHPVKSTTARIPWFAAAGVVISVLFLLFGSTFNLHLTNLFPVSSLEVRPSYDSTLTLINNARGGSFERVLVGTGPNTFGQEWLLHKPAEVNQSDFWSLNFNVGFSTFLTALGSVGLIGLIAWLIPLFLILAGLVRVVRLGVLNREDKIVATILSVSALFLFLSILLYVPSQNIALVAFVLSGAAFGFLWRQGQSSTEEGTEPVSLIARVVPLGIMAVLVLLALWTTIATNRRFLAESYVGIGSIALQNGSVDDANKAAIKAESIERTGDGLRLVVQVESTKLQQLSTATTTPSADLQQQFASTVQNIISASQMAETLNPQDYRPSLLLGQVYAFLASLNVQNAVQTASDTFTQSAVKNPTDPEIPLALARLYGAAGDKDKTTTYLSQALTLKPNYTDAILLVVQLDVANNDIPNAIKAATAAAQTAPGVGPIWFELGLLYYSAGDSADAVPALEKAISIVPDYANAKYFLGLSYYLVGKTPEAIQQFSDLKQSNPDNAEVTLILSNLQSGKKPFDGAQPPVTSTPQDRTTAPISQ